MQERIVILKYPDGGIARVLRVGNYDPRFLPALDTALQVWAGSDQDLEDTIHDVMDKLNYQIETVDAVQVRVP